MYEKFYKALDNGDINLMNEVEKSDLHCHSDRGANKKDFEDEFNIKIPNPQKFKSIIEMDDWYDKYLDKYTNGFNGLIKRYISLFKTAQSQNIKVFTPSFCLSRIKYFNNNMGEYFEFIKELKGKYAPNINFYPELELNRHSDINLTEKLFYEAIKYNFFKSIDIIGDEKLGTEKFKEIYETADKLGWVLKAHVGEFAGPEFIDEALNNLHLDAINHGLSAVESPELMKYLRDAKIMLNICPTSNVLLSRIPNYKEHPIKQFVNNDITCSINTDDLIIFNQTVSEEYFNLYNNQTLNKEELNEIRENGLKKSLVKRRDV